MKLDAILWDYDGTLVNSVPKNIAITKDILARVAPRLTGDNLPRYLTSESLYHQANHAAKNWQQLYLDYYGLSEQEMLEAGSLWSEYQEKNDTRVSLFNGMEEVIHEFSHLPHGICSQNSQQNIRRVLQQHNVDTLFKSVVGYDDISSEQQKPNPDGGLYCLERIFGEHIPNTLIYVGDHQADTEFAKNIERALPEHCQVISIAAAYSHSQPETWSIQPDHIAYQVEELITLIRQYT